MKLKFPKLPPVFKAKWVKALRSGKFKQAESLLVVKDEDDGSTIGYCCLGVACVIQGVKPDELSFIPKNDAKYKRVSEALRGDIDLPYFLSTLNDGGYYEDKLYKKRGFKGIAQWIERNL